MPIRYTWDPKKNAANIRKHGISFERAIRIFDGFTYEEQDDRYDYEEVRQVAVGVTEGAEVVVVFTDVSEEERRIISARRPKAAERERYWQARRRDD